MQGCLPTGVNGICLNPVTKYLKLVSSKWMIFIIMIFPPNSTPLRYSEIKKRINNIISKKISDTTLTSRLKDLEELALAHPGVMKTYAIQAGRELRVIVGSEKVSDAEAEKISFEISQKIQNEMTYPGQIKITVIRETRAINYAK